MNIRRRAVATILLAFLVPALAADLSPAAKSEIDQLLSALGDSPCELSSDGEWLEGEQAAAQLRQKYQALAGQIASAEDFVARVGGSERGQPYRIRCPGEEPQPISTWLKTQLTQIRKQPITDPSVYLDEKK